MAGNIPALSSSWHSSEEMTLQRENPDNAAAKSPKNRQGQARVCSTCKRQLFQIRTDVQEGKQMEPHPSCPNTPHLASWRKNLFPSSSSPPFILHLCFVSYRASTSQDVLPKWTTGPFLSYQLQLCSSLSSSSLQFLLTALQRDDITWNHPGLHWEKFFLHLLCGCCRVCRQKGTGAGQK